MNDALVKLLRTRQQLQELQGCEPSKEELARALDWPLARVDQAYGLPGTTLSLDCPVKRGNPPRTLAEGLPDSNEVDPFERADCRELAEAVEKKLSRLPAREAGVIRDRFGLGGRVPKTLEQIARELGLSRERVRQIQVKAMGLLRGRLKTLRRSD